jgi:hypothetical protein
MNLQICLVKEEERSFQKKTEEGIMVPELAAQRFIVGGGSTACSSISLVSSILVISCVVGFAVSGWGDGRRP